MSCVPGGVCVAVDSGGDVVSYPMALTAGLTPTGRAMASTPSKARALGTRPTATQVRKSLVSLLRFAPTKRSIAALLRHRNETLMWKVPYAGRLRLTLSVIVRGKPITAATANANYSKPVSVKVVVKPTRSGKRTLARKRR